MVYRTSNYINPWRNQHSCSTARQVAGTQLPFLKNSLCWAEKNLAPALVGGKWMGRDVGARCGDDDFEDLGPKDWCASLGPQMS